MGKQGASAPCPETLRGSNANTPESPRVFVLFAAKGTSFPQENSVSKAPPCDKRSGKAKCARTLPENAPGEQSAFAHRSKMCRESKVRPHIARKYAGKAKCVRTLVENTPGKQSASAHRSKMCRGSKVRLRIARKHAERTKCVRTLPENAPGEQSAFAHRSKMCRESRVRPRIGRKCAGKATRILPKALREFASRTSPKTPREFLCFLPQSGKNASSASKQKLVSSASRCDKYAVEASGEVFCPWS